jgi:hypothetical protein
MFKIARQDSAFSDYIKVTARFSDCRLTNDENVLVGTDSVHLGQQLVPTKTRIRD